MFANLAAFTCIVTVSFDGEIDGCKLIARYFYVNDLGYWFLASDIFSELIVERYTELLASNARLLLELLM